MQINRVEFGAALDRIAPALAANAATPILAHFCFDDDIIFAYDDSLALIAPYKTGLICAIPGDVLTGLLAASSDKHINIDVEKTAIKIKFSSGDTQVPVLDKSDFVFTLHDDAAVAELALSEELINGIDLCLLSVNDDNHLPEFCGVTISTSNNETVLYSTDNLTASRVVVKDKLGKTNHAVVIPKRACTQLAKLYRARTDKKKKHVLELHDGFVLAPFDDVILFSKTFPPAQKKIEAVFSEHANRKAAVDIPDGFEDEIKKSVVVLLANTTKKCSISFDKKVCRIDAAGILGKVSAALKTRGGAGQIAADPNSIARIIAKCDALSINDKRSLVLYSGETFTHIVSAKVE